jgi:hypothetical protein
MKKNKSAVKVEFQDKAYFKMNAVFTAYRRIRFPG